MSKNYISRFNTTLPNKNRLVKGEMYHIQDVDAKQYGIYLDKGKNNYSFIGNIHKDVLLINFIKEDMVMEVDQLFDSFFNI